MDQRKKTALLDFVTFAVPGILILLTVPALLLAGVHGPRGWSLIMAAVGLSFLGIWFRVYLLRLR